MPHSLTVTGHSDIGRKRARNEDSLALVPGAGVAVVADGMGGHPGGDVASRIAAARTAAALEECCSGKGLSVGGMSQAILAAHSAIREEADRTPDLAGMGTTVTALAVMNGEYTLGNVGDSRGYLLRGGSLAQLTQDDTWVQARVQAGDFTPEQARRHPYSHILSQCVGLEDAPVPRVKCGPVEADDVFLLCSDGLVGMLEDHEIQAILEKYLEADDGAERAPLALVSAANEAGGHDNITVALVVCAPDG